MHVFSVIAPLLINLLGLIPFPSLSFGSTSGYGRLGYDDSTYPTGEADFRSVGLTTLTGTDS